VKTVLHASLQRSCEWILIT